MFGDNEKNIKLSDNPSIWEINKAIYKAYKDDHFAGYDYRKHKPKIFTGAALPRSITSNDYFQSSINYVANIYEYIRHNGAGIFIGGLEAVPELKEYSKMLAKEAVDIERAGELCIYCSVLLYSLLKVSCHICKDHLKYVQGCYKHPLREDFPSFIPFSSTQIGLHAWVVIGESVLDLTIGQEDYFFDFRGELPYIAGKVPEGLDLIGHEELDIVVQKYVKKYAAAAGIDADLWILKHRIASLQAFVKFLEELQEDVALDEVVEKAFDNFEKEVKDRL